MTPQRLYWDCTAFGRHFPDGVSRVTVALAAAADRYVLPSTYLLPPYLGGGGLHRALAACPGEVVIAHRHPRRLLPWRWRWEWVLDEPGVVIAPANWHRATRWPTVVLVHDLIPFLEPDYAHFAHASPRAYGNLLERAAMVLTNSRWTADAVARLFPNVRPATALPFGFSEVVSERRPAWAPTVPFYLFVGSAEPRKQIELAAALATRLDDAGLVVIGRDWGGARTIATLAPAWSSRWPVIQRDQVDEAELSWLYAHCRALLYPTRHEGFGYPALEVLRAGRPVVARPLTSLPEVLGDHALWHDFATDADVAALRTRIDAWRPTPALTQHLSTFTWERARGILAQAVAAACAEAR